jgi:hypothetical protein
MPPNSRQPSATAGAIRRRAGAQMKLKEGRKEGNWPALKRQQCFCKQPPAVSLQENGSSMVLLKMQP